MNLRARWNFGFAWIRSLSATFNRWLPRWRTQGWSYRVPMLTGSVESLYEFEKSGKIGSEELSKLMMS